MPHYKVSVRHYKELCDSETADEVWRSRTLALLPGIDFQKLSARHNRNRTSRNF